HALAAVGVVLDLLHREVDRVAQRHVVLAAAPLGDRVDLRLGGVDEVVDVPAVGGVPELGDPGAGLDQPAQHGLVPHEPGVVAGVRRRGYRGDEGVEVGGTADPAQLAALVQLGGDGHGVGRLPPAVQVDDRV